MGLAAFFFFFFCLSSPSLLPVSQSTQTHMHTDRPLLSLDCYGLHVLDAGAGMDALEQSRAALHPSARNGCAQVPQARRKIGRDVGL